MICLADNLNIGSAEVKRINGEYLSFVGMEHVHSCSARGWDYAAILHYGNFRDSDIVLDVGCGASYLALFLCEFVKASYGIDDLENGGFAKFDQPWLSTLSDFEAYRKGRFVLHNQNAADLPFEDMYFDKVVTVSAMEHFAGTDDTLCAKEVYRVLKPGGSFLGTVDYNAVAEHPLPDSNPGVRTYTYEAFLRRIVQPSGWELQGTDFLAGVPVPLEYKSIARAMFFHLTKGKMNEDMVQD